MVKFNNNKNININPNKIELTTSIEKPIIIKQIRDNCIDWNFIIPTCISLLSISIVIFDRIKKSKIRGKIVSIAYSISSHFESYDLNNNKKEYHGQQYFLKLSLQVTQKDLFFQNVNIKVMYKNDSTIYNAEIFWLDSMELKMKDNKTYDLKIPKNEFLSFNNTLTKNTVSFQYISFIVEVDKTDPFEEIFIEFIDEKGKTKKVLPIKTSEINYNIMLFDKDIFIERKQL